MSAGVTLQNNHHQKQGDEATKTEWGYWERKKTRKRWRVNGAGGGGVLRHRDSKRRNLMIVVAFKFLNIISQLSRISLPCSSDAWPFWSCLNRLRTTVGWSRANFQTWEYTTGADPIYQCRQLPTTQHLVFPNLEDPYTRNDLKTLTLQTKFYV